MSIFILAGVTERRDEVCESWHPLLTGVSAKKTVMLLLAQRLPAPATGTCRARCSPFLLPLNVAEVARSLFEFPLSGRPAWPLVIVGTLEGGW